jgi:hypothetical protein
MSDFDRDLQREYGEAAREIEIGRRVLHSELAERHFPDRIIAGRGAVAQRRGDEVAARRRMREQREAGITPPRRARGRSR